MTDLSTYLEQSGETQAQFAQRVGLNQATVSKICARRVGVSLATALRIEQVTGGKVPVSSLLHVSSPSLAPSSGAGSEVLPAPQDVGTADADRKGAV